jgi:hypothetical protein
LARNDYIAAPPLVNAHTKPEQAWLFEDFFRRGFALLVISDKVSNLIAIF